MAGNSAESGRSVASKLASILVAFSGAGELSLTEIARRAALPVSTAHRLTAELAERRLLTRTEDGRYRAGLTLHMLCAGNGIAAGPELEERAARVLEDLSAVTGCRARLGVLYGHEIAFLEKLPGTRPVSGFRADATLPAASSALGRALLAFSPAHDVDKVVDHGLGTDSSADPLTVDAFDRILRAARVSRMAVDLGGPGAGSCCFAMPVFGAGGVVAASLGLTVADASSTLKPLMAALAIAARSLSRELAASRWPL